jgi:hypothetical protein
MNGAGLEAAQAYTLSQRAAGWKEKYQQKISVDVLPIKSIPKRRLKRFL